MAPFYQQLKTERELPIFKSKILGMRFLKGRGFMAFSNIMMLVDGSHFTHLVL